MCCVQLLTVMIRTKVFPYSKVDVEDQTNAHAPQLVHGQAERGDRNQARAG